MGEPSSPSLPSSHTSPSPSEMGEPSSPSLPSSHTSPSPSEMGEPSSPSLPSSHTSPSPSHPTKQPHSLSGSRPGPLLSSRCLPFRATACIYPIHTWWLQYLRHRSLPVLVAEWTESPVTHSSHHWLTISLRLLPCPCSATVHQGDKVEPFIGALHIRGSHHCADAHL
jgi:hypothetical protein